MMRKHVLAIAAAASSLLLPIPSFAAGQHSGGHGQQADGHAQHGQQPGQAGEQDSHGHAAHGESQGAASGPVGKPGDPDKVSRVIDMTMDDKMRFYPDQITVEAGETVRFFIKNVGQVPHEFVLGSVEELRAHAEEMRKAPHAMQHSEPNQITLGPGQMGGVVWQFAQAGTVDFACLIPGHFEAGMVGKVLVQ